MPIRDTQDHLQDILDAVAVVQSFIEGMTFANYEADLKTRSAVERQLQILTEAAFRLKDDAPKLCPDINWRKVRGLGNFLRHEYHNVSDETIWNELHELLPSLETAVRSALKLRAASIDPA